MSNIKLTDTSLRDGSHTISHKWSPADITRIAGALDEAGIDLIEVGHGDGLTGSTINYGFADYSDFDLLEAAAGAIKRAKLTALLLPGIGTVEDLEALKKVGIQCVRVATHCTEADIAAQHIAASREMGFFTVGFLMMAHMNSTAGLVEEAKKMESYGAEVVYVTDSAGAMLPQDVTEKVTALRESISVPIGHHAHDNLGLSVANSVAAIQAGATFIDGSLGGLGAGGGNTPTEEMVAVFKRMGLDINADLYKTIDASADVLEDVLKTKTVMDYSQTDALMLGYTGVYSSFMLHARRAASRFNVDYRDILLELGKRGAVGGQEDWIIEIAAHLADS